MKLVLSASAFIAFLLAIHPYVIFPCSLWVLAKLRRQPQKSRAVLPTPQMSAASERNTTLAVLLCVHNEEKVIESRVANLLEATEALPGTQVLIYSDGSTDDTAEILKRFEGSIILKVAKERHGKTFGMNTLASATRAGILVFTDAAVQMNAATLPNIVEHFEDPMVGCVCGRIIATTHTSMDREIGSTAETSIRYWSFDAAIRNLETRVASTIGAHGPLFAVRRTLHEPVPIHLIDDFYVSMNVLHKGYRVVQADDVCGFKAVATHRGEEYARKVRIACQAYNVHRLLVPQLKRQTWLIRYLYAGHKFLRWNTIFFLTAAALLGSIALILSIGWKVVAGAWGLLAFFILLGVAGLRPFTHGIDAMTALIANGAGIIQSLRGENYRTWSSAQSARRAE